MADKTYPLSLRGKVVGTAKMNENGGIEAVIDKSLLTEEEQSMLFGDWSKGLSLETDKSNDSTIRKA